MTEPTKTLPLFPHQIKALENIQGGFKRGEFYMLGSMMSPLPKLAQGLRDLFDGKENVVIGPEESHQLFGGKSSLMWSMILKNPVLLERYKKATHVIFDLEGSVFDNLSPEFQESLSKLWVSK